MSNLLETASQGAGPNNSRKNRTHFKRSPINAYYAKNLRNKNAFLPDMDTLHLSLLPKVTLITSKEVV